MSPSLADCTADLRLARGVGLVGEVDSLVRAVRALARAVAPAANRNSAIDAEDVIREPMLLTLAALAPPRALRIQ